MGGHAAHHETRRLAEAVARYPQRPALEFFGAVTTYRELADEVGRVAGAGMLVAGALMIRFL